MTVESIVTWAALLRKTRSRNLNSRRKDMHMPHSAAQSHINLLGKTATDKVTGFKGIVTSISFDLFGCIQVILTPSVDKEGKAVDSRWLDVGRLKISPKKPVIDAPDFGQGYIAEGKKGGFDKPIQ